MDTVFLKFLVSVNNVRKNLAIGFFPQFGAWLKAVFIEKVMDTHTCPTGCPNKNRLPEISNKRDETLEKLLISSADTSKDQNWRVYTYLAHGEKIWVCDLI